MIRRLQCAHHEIVMVLALVIAAAMLYLLINRATETAFEEAFVLHRGTVCHVVSP